MVGVRRRTSQQHCGSSCCEDPGPPAHRWPLACRQGRQDQRGPSSRRQSFAQSAPQGGLQPQQSSAEAVHPRLSPAEFASNETWSVSRLERCIAQLSLDDSAELRSLQAADCQQYCSRAKRRSEKAQEAAKAAQEAVVRFEVELQEGLRRLGGGQGRSRSTPCGARYRGGSAHNGFVSEGEPVASCRPRVYSRAGQPPCRHLRRRSTNPDSVGCGARALIEEADTDLRRSQQGRFAP